MNSVLRRIPLSIAMMVIFIGTAQAQSTNSVVTGIAKLLPTQNQTAAQAAKAEAARWLQLAKRSMQEGNYQLADEYIKRAERLNPVYDPAVAQFEDTPQSVRQALNNLATAGNRPMTVQPTTFRVGGTQADSANSAIGRLSNQNKTLATAAIGKARAALQNGDLTTATGWYHKALSYNASFQTGEYGTAQLAADLSQSGVANAQLQPRVNNQTVQQPGSIAAGPADQVAPLGGNSALGANGNAFSKGYIGTPASTNSTDSKIASIDGFLLAARRALAVGDTRAATAYLETARKTGITTASNGDNIGAVDYVIKGVAYFSQNAQSTANPAEFNGRFARFLIHQSQALLKYKDWKTAGALAQQAKGIPTQYQPNEATPAAVLQFIAQNSQESVGISATTIAKKDEVLRLLSIAQASMDRGDLNTAKQALANAQSLNVPDTAFTGNEPRPWQISLELENRIKGNGTSVVTANFTDNNGGYVRNGAYNTSTDESPIRFASGTATFQGNTNISQQAQKLYDEGLAALELQDRTAATKKFREAWAFKDNVDPALRSQIQQKLQQLALSAAPSNPVVANENPLSQLDTRERILRQKLFTEIMAEQREAEDLADQDPRVALEQLLRLHERVDAADLDETNKKRLLAIVDRSVVSLEEFIKRNEEDIILDEDRAATLQLIKSNRERTQEVREEIAKMVERFNNMVDEGRYGEAEVIAKQAKELAPEEAVVQNLEWKAKFAKRIAANEGLTDLKENEFWETMNSVDVASVPFNDQNPLVFDQARDWGQLTRNRRKMMQRNRTRLSEAGLKIEQALRQQVDVNFTATPLAVVVETLARMSGINAHLDRQGLAAEGVTSDTPVTISLSEPVSLRSALNLILEELQLGFIIRNEVLLITSEQARETDVYEQVYNVADLVISVPNFSPSNDFGIPTALRAAYQRQGTQGAFGNSMSALAASNYTMPGAMPNTDGVMAQATGGLGAGASSLSSPGAGLDTSRGGAAMADFQSLIELITTTIEPDSWEDNGGSGVIKEFRSTFSLVVTQTHDVHEEIQQLLEQLREQQGLQITIEVRFITLTDNFYERIGIDFDFEIDDNVNPNNIQDDSGSSVLFGYDEAGPTVDLDLVFDQGDAFNSAVPMFGGFDAGSAANFGFAILSDIEVFFLLQAAQGDRRSNVMTAPKVTLFNGQTASIADASTRPFVMGLSPVVGDFAVAHQPIIAVLNEGTSLSVQAVASNDRRSCRLTLVPFFSQIGDVDEFTFDGRTTTSSGETVLDSDGNPTTRNNEVVTQEGTTVQLPTFNFTTVSTTVNVPDGGTVLLGGIKRLSEGREERGVPMLAQLPYINRLFRNVGIGRDSNSMMMMVTPRIIIQEEEELRQTGYSDDQDSNE